MHSIALLCSPDGFFEEFEGFRCGDLVGKGENWGSYSCSSHGHRQQERELGNPLFVKW